MNKIVRIIFYNEGIFYDEVTHKNLLMCDIKNLDFEFNNIMIIDKKTHEDITNKFLTEIPE